MNFMKRNKNLEHIEISRHIMKKLNETEINWIISNIILYKPDT